MSKMFSVVTLASDSGLLEEYYAPEARTVRKIFWRMKSSGMI